MAIFHLTESDFDTVTAEGVSLIDFWADWCPPCKMLAPVIEELAEKLDGTVRVCKVDVDSQPKLAERFGVSSIPTILIIRDGVEINRGVGAMPIEALESLLA